jgi:hypothetical protein
MPSGQLVDRGDLSLALAGAELIDLLGAGALVLSAGRAVPGSGPIPGDRLLAEALSSAPSGPAPAGEAVEEWLWRRGRGLPGVYLAVLEEEGTLVRENRRRWGVFPAGRLVLAGTPDRRRAALHWSSDDPVLLALAALIGIPSEDPASDQVPPVAPDSPAGTVLGDLAHAVAELAEERRRRASRLDRANATYRTRGF